MEWTEKQDTLLCPEVLLKYKKGSYENGKKWTEIAEALKKREEVKFSHPRRCPRKDGTALKEAFEKKERGRISKWHCSR